MVNHLHITVNASGVISLWDSRRAAEDGMAEGERYMLLLLTPQQQRSVENVRRSIQEVPSDPQPK